MAVLAPPPYHPALLQILTETIASRADRWISFADYMAIVLYDPTAGYYATRAARGIGPGGDFVTSPHMGPDFGELLAEQLVDCWRRLGQPEPFDLVEMGAGQGLLAADVLGYLRDRHGDCYQAVRYRIIERAAAAIAAQKQRLEPWHGGDDPSDGGSKVSWCSWDDIPSRSLVGCCFSNELVDAFPVHRVRWDGTQLQEIYVALAGEPRPSVAAGLTEVTGPLSSDRVGDYFALVGIDWRDRPHPAGYVTEVNLDALDWLSTVADRLDRGHLLTIDYGYDADRYYQSAREGGTLRCYSRHAHHGDPYAYIGYQDITAHVDFTALERWGDRCGLHTVGRTQQALFLMALGLGDRLSALAHDRVLVGGDLQAVLQRRDALHRLMDPLGLGNFGVLIQSTAPRDRDWTPRGLAHPV